jgi:tetratricopeptide (TPR) repeat protein
VKPLTIIQNPWRILHIALIVLAGAAVYSNTLHAEFVMDDYSVIGFHGPMDILTILLHGTSRRVTDATFAVNYHLHGLDVAGYHLVNLAIHLAAAFTLYFFVISVLAALRVTFSPSEHATEQVGFVELFVPFAVALLFVVHPVQTQAVTYIVQRYTSLATFLYILSALLFLRARLASNKSCIHLYPWFLGSTSLAVGILAVGSKQIAITLPLMLISLELFLFRGRLINRRFFIVCGILIALVLALVVATWHDCSLRDFSISLHHATSENHYISRLTYALTQSRVVATYLRLLCLPFGQSLFHDYRIYSTLFALPVIASLALHIFLITTAMVLFRVSGRELLSGDQLRGVLQRLASLGIVWFYIAMMVESSFFPITDIIFEHRIYLPSVGFFLTTAAGIALAAHGSWLRSKTAWSLLVTTCCVLGGLTFARNQVWSDTLLLWQDTVKKAPTKDLAIANLAGEYMKLDMPDKALPLFVRALELNQIFMTTTKVRLGLTLQRLNVDSSRFTTGEEIIPIREKTGRVELGRDDESRLQCVMYNNLGLAHEYLGEPDKARERYRAALMINPVYDLAWYNLGLLSLQLGDMGQADNAQIQLRSINSALAEALTKTMQH